MASELICRCGKPFRHIPAGISKKSSRPYDAFWACTNSPRICGATLTEEEYAKMQHLDKLPGSVQVRGPRSYIREGYRARPPKKATNPIGKLIPFRRMTDEQEVIISQILSSNGKFVVEANCDAGTGKSSTIRQLAARTKPEPGEHTTGIILTFGRKATHDTRQELPPHWVASTIHSIGNEMVCAFYGTGYRNINEKKTWEILCDEYGKPEGEDKAAQVLLYGIVDGLVELSKALALDENTADDAAIIQWATFYNVDLGDNVAQACTMARNVLKISRSLRGIKMYGHNFDDQVWLPVVNNLPAPKYRYVIGDEWQDSSLARIKLAMKIVGKTFAYVGDTDQAIFGFTFADTTSMDTCKRLCDEVLGLAVQSFPMTINWRCPAIVLEATRIIHPSIRTRPNAPMGYMHLILQDHIEDHIKIGDLVLCRVNADLVRLAYQFIKAGLPAVVLGRDIAKRLKEIILQFAFDKDKNYVPTLTMIRRLGEWYMEQGAAIEEKNLRNTERALQDLDDNYFCILALAGAHLSPTNVLLSVDLPNVKQVLDKIDEMFAEDTDGTYDPKRTITLATVHKLKGGQNARVFLLNAAEYHPHPLAESEWELVQEMCILYVALTRCGDGTSNPDQRLYFVNGVPQVLIAGGIMSMITEETI
jgi:hypothetical protein